MVHAHRNPETVRNKQRRMVNSRRPDELAVNDLDTLTNGLLKFTDRPAFDEHHRKIS